MPGYLSSEWSGKRITVVWSEPGSGGIEATVVNDSEGGLFVDVAGEGGVPEATVRRVFIPWSAVRYVELLEEPSEDPGLQMGPAW